MRRARRKTVPPELADMVRSYLETALWSSTDDDDGPLDDRPISVNLHNEALDTCRGFLAECARRGLGALGTDLRQIGHDLWLTQNGHGAGFWDGGYDRGDDLTAVAKTFGAVDLYVYRGRITVI